MQRRAYILAGLYLGGSMCVDFLVAKRDANFHHRQNPKRELSFELNRGQAPAGYQFLARDPFGVFLLRGNQFVFGRGHDAVRVIFRGGDAGAQASGEEPRGGTTNYLLGRHPSDWVTDVSAYGRVRVAGLYPGIDAVYYSAQGSLETDFIAQPGSRPQAMRLHIEGVARPVVTGSGDVQVHTREGLFAIRKPVVYQREGIERKAVPCRFAVQDDGDIGFELGSYDASLPLVIDPVLSYSTYLGGSGNETAVRVAMDAQGNSYVAGMSTSSDFPVVGNAVAPPPAGFPSEDVLITKFDPQGKVVYSTHVGGTGHDMGFGIAVDSQGQVYVTGSTNSRDFPLKNAVVTTYQGGGDGFAFALNAAGNGFVYSTYLGGKAVDAGLAIAVDGAQNAYIAGLTASANFPLKNALQTGNKGGKGGSNQPFYNLGDAFVTKLSPAGALVYSTYYGGSDDDVALAIAVDGTGAAYVGGFTTSSDFPLQSPLQTRYMGAGQNATVTTGDAFVFKLSPDGSQALYSTYLGGSADDVICGIAVDGAGNAYLAGSTFSTNFPVSNAQQNAYGGQGASDYFKMGSGDAFIAKLAATGTNLMFATYLGGNSDDRAFAIALDGAGNIHVAGNTASSNFPVSSDALQKSMAGAGVVSVSNLLPGGYVKAPVGFGDAFYARYTPAGVLAYNTYLGGSDDDVASGLAVDCAGNAVISGNTVSQNFPTAGSPFQSKLAGFNTTDALGHGITSLLFGDAFFARISATGAAPAIASSNGVISAGQFGAFTTVAPGSWIEIYGANLAANTRQWAGSDFNGTQAPTKLDQTSVTVGGQSAYIDFISPCQVNAQVPSGVGTGQQQVVLTNGTAVSTPATISVAQTAAGLLAPSAFTIGGKQYVAGILPDGSYALPAGAIPGLASRPANPGETIVMYGIGFGAVTPSSPAGQIVQQSNALSASFSMSIGGSNAAVAYAGLAPGYVGLYQFNVIAPNVAASASAAVTFTLGGQAGTQTLYLAVN